MKYFHLILFIISNYVFMTTNVCQGEHGEVGDTGTGSPGEDGVDGASPQGRKGEPGMPGVPGFDKGHPGEMVRIWAMGCYITCLK